MGKEKAFSAENMAGTHFPTKLHIKVKHHK